MKIRRDPSRIHRKGFRPFGEGLFPSPDTYDYEGALAAALEAHHKVPCTRANAAATLAELRKVCRDAEGGAW